jgi:hypothetical protein
MNVKMFFRHYRNPRVKKADGAAYFEIWPATEAANIVAMAQATPYPTDLFVYTI